MPPSSSRAPAPDLFGPAVLWIVLGLSLSALMILGGLAAIIGP